MEQRFREKVPEAQVRGATRLDGCSLSFLVFPVVDRDIAAAARAIEVALGQRGWNQIDLARAAEVDPGTLYDFMAGRRWPQVRTRSRIETSLEMEPGTIARIAAGETVGPRPQDAAPDLPVGAGVDPELLTQLAQADPDALEAVRAVLRAARRGD